MLCLTTVYKDIGQNMHFDVVLSVFILYEAVCVRAL